MDFDVDCENQIHYQIFAFFTFDLYPIREILFRAIASRRDQTCTTDFRISSFPVANPKSDMYESVY